ncbi:DMT family transporter [Campylobacter suis]|uniref:EamA domain-containing protein n=1 Tax=Campylobacter suis TaxID=2790657 RepID=A0ABN7K960_9BACT|nr:DMT family transporter [Campylobacter suis]CAD7288991.1 hypothetical protein LMG8286_01594 [Campylobacter suis]
MTLQTKADLALIVVALVWGITFLPMGEALKTNGVFVMLFWRFFLSGIFMSLVALKLAKKFDINSVKYGVVLGVVLFSSFAFQTFALKLTYSSTVAFITGLECVMVPFIAAACFRQGVSVFAIVGAFVAIFGLWFLSDAKLGLGFGELFALLCAVFYALYTVLNGHFVVKCELYTLVCTVFFVIAIISFGCAFVFENGVIPVLDEPFFRAIVITVVFGTIFCYFLQTAMQRYTTATKAALFFSLEPVSAGFVGYYFGAEILTLWQIFGAAMIICGVLISELGAYLLSSFKTKSKEANRSY